VSRHSNVGKRSGIAGNDQAERLRDLCASGWGRFRSGDHGGGISAAREALKLRPRNADALNLLYNSAVESRQFAAIGEHGDTLISIFDDLNPDVRLNIGLGYQALGRLSDAARVFTEVAMHAPLRSRVRRRALELLGRVAPGRDAGVRSAPQRATPPHAPPHAPARRSTAQRAAPASAPAVTPAAVPEPKPEPDHYRPRVSIAFAETAAPSFASAPCDSAGVRLRDELEAARLIRGFDDLVCLKSARGVDHYWYQVETVKRALKRFRGRVLLADEVGLGKTVEAAMIAAEYLARGMVKSVLVLVPASLVTQWRDEFREKFGVELADAAERCDEPAFWAGADRVVASIALARRQPHFGSLVSREWDLVIVDEAHRLKNRRTRGWELVNTLRPRFLVMLSATPVQNDIVELYNIVTLLRPGTLGTESEFRKRFVKHDGVKDVDALRDLLASVMVRNTRSLIDAKLPPRFATTVVVDPLPAEARGLQCAGRTARELVAGGRSGARMAAAQLLLQAGSSPAALAAALERVGPNMRLATDAEVRALEDAGAGSKGRALLDIVHARPDEKILVFTQFTRTLSALSTMLAAWNVAHATFTGSMSAAEKEAAVARFRGEANVLVSTGSGGEGRNLQFARTVVNFDLPWNPMTIEQRIGRVHRLGQTRDVFVFNLALRESLEERLLDVLDRKINMFELVVGEIDEILGDLDGEFSEIVFDLWLGSASDADLGRGFDDLARAMVAARERLRRTKELDGTLFGEDLGT
jgi:superfamily II DNA or RNA helicase